MVLIQTLNWDLCLIDASVSVRDDTSLEMDEVKPKNL